MKIWNINKILTLSAIYDCNIINVYNPYLDSYSVIVQLPRKKKSLIHFTVLQTTVDDVYTDIVKLLEENK